MFKLRFAQQGIFLVTLALILGGCAGKSPSRGLASEKGNHELNGRAAVQRDLDRGLSFVPNELLVQFKTGTQEAARSQALERVSGKRQSTLVRGVGGNDLDLIQVTHSGGVPGAIAAILADDSVEFAEPNWEVKHFVTSNDPYYTSNQLWGMYGDTSSPANTFGSRAAKAWANSADCSNVVVGIIDEGYMHTHPDLMGNAYSIPGEIDGNGIDDDGNGYVDDTKGWDFSGNDKTVFDGAADDHGTHVAGTIGATGGNGVGVAGVCWSVKLLNAKRFLNQSRER